MAIPGELTTIQYVPPVPPAEFDFEGNEAAYDVYAGKARVILAQQPADTIPNGGQAIATVLEDYPYGQSDDTDSQAEFAAAWLDAIDGVIESFLHDEGILTTEEAQLLSAGTLEKLSQEPISLTFETSEYGFEAGQVIRFQDDDVPLDVYLVINQVSGSTEEGEIRYSISAGTQEKITMGILVGRAARRALRAKVRAQVQYTLNPA
jgi:hypothetical protein